ncbi:glycoside hydrolase [Flavobacterium circumlabens]|uniref:Glycoside hydrolase n=1 Tax=Flavobacterium circumlabens TaxID=2133765 RepID=A0A4Y7U8B7_9FLAO|nr:glycoside hydrolase [Flavobacterium circumlabens]TCN53722.1 xylan 1,4-beta-xylosidase [Flavobacterium circumlabens]TEB42670.1 glycoside hydrolase [Flavobacterium circumlabens]
MKRNLIVLFVLISLINGQLFAQNSGAQKSSEDRIIKVDYNKSAGAFNTMFKECVGAGRANEGLRADWQQQLTMLKKDCDFKYIRMHGLLSDDMAVYYEDEKGNSQYNYQYVDALFDFIVSIKMKPFVELGFMPSGLASGKQTIFWWKGNVTPPKDYKKWEDFIQHLTVHFTERYGAEEVKTWYFEVWNEPNLSPGFWTGTQQDYFKLYEYAARGIKSVNTAYKVGGPATAGAAWVPETIDFCAKNKVPIDFISTHTYGVKSGYLDEFGTSGTILNKEDTSVSGDVLNSRQQIANSAKPNLELHYTEWSSSYTPADPIHDSYHSAAYILQKLKQVGNAANSMSYWVFTDIFEEAGPRYTPFHGGFGLLNLQGIKKPAYFSYSFLNKLGETELENKDTSSWVCKNSKGDVQLLFWDFTNTHPGDKVLNQNYYIQDLPSKEKGKVKIEIDGLQKGKYILEIYKVGYKVNDAYADYLSMGRPKQLTVAQVHQIKEKNSGALLASEKVIIDSKGTYSKDFSINENDVFLLNLVKQ